ncbi:MAG: SH3 domain-containing protein [Flexilinea sp.]|nr:SH3 domain-containing protein [Flexilinea sp.]
MKKLILVIGMILCFCLIGGTAMADTINNQMGQPMGSPQMNGGQNGQIQGQPPMGGGQNGQMQGQPPMNLAVVETDDETAISMLSEADSSADVLTSVENGTIVEILEENGDYTKVRIKGTTGYVLSSALADLTPGDGQEPPAKPEDGQEPPAKPEVGQEPPAKPEDGQEPPAKPEDGQQITGQPVNGQLISSQPQMDPTGEQNESLEPGIQSFFKAFLNFLTGKKEKK